MKRVVISLGSNLGDRADHLKKAAKAISRLGLHIESSYLYETQPWGLKEQPAFLNAAMSFETTLKPEELLQELQNIEFNLGRTKTIKWGPRVIDIDIILFDTVTQTNESLKIPHPHFTNRLFVLLPMTDLKKGSQLINDVTGKTIASYISKLQNEGVVKMNVRLL